MIVGVPKEVKRDEYRVGLLPVGVEELTRPGHKVLVEAGAGLGSGLPDHDYLRHGAEMVTNREEVYEAISAGLKCAYFVAGLLRVWATRPEGGRA